MDENATELARRVLAMGNINPEYNATHARQARAMYRKYALESVPTLAQAVLCWQTQLDFANQQLEALQAHHESDHAKHKEEVKQLKLDRSEVDDLCEYLRDKNADLKAEISALRPDAEKWREREAKYQAEIAELKGRMQAPGEKGGEG